MTEIEHTNNKESAEKKVDKMIVEVTEKIGTIDSKERNKTLNDPDLAEKAKKRVIAKMDKFEKDFRKRIGEQRIYFISALQNFIDTDTPSPEEETNFIKIKVGEYATSMATCLMLTASEQTRKERDSKLSKIISQEVP